MSNVLKASSFYVKESVCILWGQFLSVNSLLQTIVSTSTAACT